MVDSEYGTDNYTSSKVIIEAIKKSRNAKIRS